MIYKPLSLVALWQEYCILLYFRIVRSESFVLTFGPPSPRRRQSAMARRGPSGGIGDDARRKYEAETIGNILAHQRSYHPSGLCRGGAPGRVLLAPGDG
jgi:hypothetical protein